MWSEVSEQLAKQSLTYHAKALGELLGLENTVIAELLEDVAAELHDGE